MACSYFAKNVPRLTQQKQDKNWSKYSVLELRGATLGIIGYGDIGRACAKLANAYGMNVVALRRKRPTEDELCRAVYENSRDNLYKLMGESDYILCSAPLTPETRGMLDAEAFAHAKRDSVFINVGRGPIVNENALIDALSKMANSREQHSMSLRRNRFRRVVNCGIYQMYSFRHTIWIKPTRLCMKRPNSLSRRICLDL